MMISAISEGVKISVKVQYLEESSDPSLESFIYAYTIELENKNVFPVRLLNRHWFIFDSFPEHREVIGEGVIGEQPVLEPNGRHVYTSGCDLRSEFGSMHGHYEFKRLDTGDLFKVDIPRFELSTTYKMN